MHPEVGKQAFVAASLEELVRHLNEGSDDVRASIAEVIGSSDKSIVETERSKLTERFSLLRESSISEPSHRDVHYVSRFSALGVYQSVLAKVFNSIPALQGYGNGNPIWVVTWIEQGSYALKNFFQRIHEDVAGNKEPLFTSILKEWRQIRFERAPYPRGTPQPLPLAADATIALLADWGGDNPAARHVASVVQKNKPTLAVHLGDIYYGGIAAECETFLQLWPFQTNTRNPLIGIPIRTSLALNGNHEMYSGGEAYFNVVLKAFGQPQPFFCLENQYWRLIGLDTAYAGGRLKPQSADDPIASQWNWLIDLLKNGKKRANIFLTHHQPVSAHKDEYNDSAALRTDIADLLAINGVGEDAIFGWFFGHEHRCALYRDSELPYNARLIGNGCIPHEVQQEKTADSGCNAVDFFNKRQDAPGSGAAVSMFAKLTFLGTSGPGSELLIQYIDEDNEVWGSEVWDARKGRLGGGKFQETDFDDRLLVKV
jgi:hypothetical protein